MTTKVQYFRELHKAHEPLILGNVWNVQSAKIYQELGYQAIGTSSAAIANSLGYEDGENMSFDEYFFIIERILKNTSLSVTVDLESGYGTNVETIYQNIKALAKIGVVGINIEDSILIGGKRELEDKVTFLNKLESLTHLLKEDNIDLFINVRCDAFLLQLPNAISEAIDRIKLYETQSVDGIFLPCITSENDIKVIIANTKSPINVMCMPNLLDFNELQLLGVKRISMGNFVFDFGYRKIEEISKSIISNQNFQSLF